MAGYVGPTHVAKAARWVAAELTFIGQAAGLIAGPATSSIADFQIWATIA
ncbi:MAG TPA: hypothetical protein VNS22_12985 [Geminicoccus sp.]|nr:hypothetical protein [Geminicoccus sp.]HWL69287.1 hypothetical protein [Geminicoccus sp.]